MTTMAITMMAMMMMMMMMMTMMIIMMMVMSNIPQGCVGLRKNFEQICDAAHSPMKALPTYNHIHMIMNDRKHRHYIVSATSAYSTSVTCRTEHSILIY
jgi:hypothetical protein